MWRGAVHFSDAQVKTCGISFVTSAPRSRKAHCCLTCRCARSFSPRRDASKRKRT
jgi:hypothetical protein